MFNFTAITRNAMPTILLWAASLLATSTAITAVPVAAVAIYPCP